MTGTKATTLRRTVLFSLLLLSLLVPAFGQPTLRVTAQDYEDYSRVIITFPSPLSIGLEQDGAFLQIRINSPAGFRLRADRVKSRLLKSFSWVKGSDFYLLIVEAQHGRFRYETFQIERRRQLVIDFYEVAEEPAASPPAEQEQVPPPPPLQEEAAPVILPPAETAPPLAAKGIRTIVIDPGHGGLETGAKGKFGHLEKDITLGIALKLKSVIEKGLAFRVELTRDRDIDVTLENRAALANNHSADLFISIHANGSYRRNANGSETFFLSLNATDEEARRLAYLENKSADLGKPIAAENADEIQMILWDMAQSAYLKQSQRLAEIIQDELNSLLGTADRGIKQAPFKVLTGVASPAVLVEVAFLSNPEEERQLVSADFQGNVAEAIYRGLVRYLRLVS